MMDHLTAVARGLEPANLLLTNAKLVNVFSGEIYPTNVAISGEWIAGVDQAYTQGKEITRFRRPFSPSGVNQWAFPSGEFFF